LFDRLARQSSTCIHTRDDGGEIGWVDNPNYNNRQNDNTANNVADAADNQQNNKLLNEAVSDIISPQVIEQLFQQRVKGGDVLKIPTSSIYTNDQDSQIMTKWHIVRVDDLHLRPITTSSSSSTSSNKNVIHKIRPKLKGSGVIPLSPAFQKNNNPNKDDKLINDTFDTQSIYTIPNAKYYKIVTTGCQMNVADSERIMGVLEGELGLSSLDDLDNQHTDNSINHHVDQTLKKTINKKNQTPDILLLNTCTIRDHAEQKVYDALGPYAAMKRAGKPLAIVVAGCVAQQEGKSARIILIALYPSNRYLIKLISQSNDVLLFLLGEALLRRFPEIDLVLGPQYIPWLSDLLIEVGKGSQLCMTESMLWSESGGAAETKGKGWNSSREKDGDWMVPIKRGHSVRGWVNVIYGCNE
jgi:hypothetical protein